MRLYKGDFGQETRYDVDPLELAGRYRELGADWLHVVDLDGARSGVPVNLDLVKRMAADAGMRIQLGGGIRDEKSLAAALGAADRVVLGSLAAEAIELVIGWMRAYGADRLTLGFDVRLDADGVPRLATHGWTQTPGTSLDEALDAYRPAGLKHVLCTDVERDGAMAGPNLDLYSIYASRWSAIEFQASGGVRNVADLEALAKTGVGSAISGRALLDGRLSKEEIQRFLPNA